MRIIADFSIHPIGEGTSVGKYVKRAFDSMKAVKGIEVELTPMATLIESDSLDAIFEAIKRAHSALFEMGAKRVSFILRVDDRIDKPRTRKEKVQAVLPQAAFFL